MSDSDKNILKRRFKNSFETYNKHAKVQQLMASKLADMLLDLDDLCFERILEIGCGTGLLTKKILKNYTVEEYFLNDLVDDAFYEVQNVISDLNFKNFKFISGDAELLTFPENLNAIVSSSSFHWLNNLENFFLRMYNLLENQGIFAFSTFGQDNFREVKEITKIGLVYNTLKEILDFLKLGFELIKVEEWKQEVKFESPNNVLKHMKYTGVNGLNKTFFGKEKLNVFNEQYYKLFSNEDNSVNLTYHPIIIIARKK